MVKVNYSQCNQIDQHSGNKYWSLNLLELVQAKDFAINLPHQM